MPATDSSISAAILSGRNRVLQDLARGASLEAVLTTLCRSAEEILPELRCSILLLDADTNRLRHGAAPSLPDFYMRAIDGIEIGPEVGSCGAAAHYGKRVIVEDVRSHPNWAAHRELAEMAEIRACWSEPIFAAGGDVLGTFAMYYSEPRRPEGLELELIETTAQVAGIAIERQRDELKRIESERRFRQLTEAIREVFWLTDWKSMKVLYVSPAYETIWGRSCESLYDDSLSWSEDVHPEDRARVVEAFRAKAESGTYDEEYRITRPDGSVHWIHDRAFPIRDQVGQVVQMGGISEDITKQKRVELSLRESESRFRDVVDTMRELFWLIDWESQSVIYVSPAFEAIWGHPQEAVLSGKLQWYDVIHADDREHVLTSFMQDAPRGKYDVEFRLVREDGVRWIHERAFPIRDDDGNIIRMAGISEDVTDRKETELSLHASEERFRQLAESIREVLHLTDFETGEMLYVSPAYETVWGRTCESLCADAESWTRSIHDEDRERVLEAFRGDAASGEFDVEYRIVHPDGAIRWIHDRSFPIREHGRVVRLAGIAEDITDYKTVELALRELESRFRQLTETMSGIVWLTDWKNRRILYVSPAWETVWGTPVKDLYENPKSWSDCIHPEDRERVTAAFQEQAEQGTYDQDFRIVRPDGTERWIHERAFPIRDSDGTVYRMAGIAEDITDRKSVELELQETRDELASRSRAQLQSLTAELLLAEERERRKLSQDLHDGLNQTITLALMKLADLRERVSGPQLVALREIEGLVEQANESARSLTFQLSPPILHDLGFEPAVQWLVEDIERTYGLEIELHEPGHPCQLEERVRILLFRAVRELLINVAKHAQARSARVRLQCGDDYMNIAVEDDGVAFDAELVGRRGIGLNSIRERLSHLGGSMSIESKPGSGTTVSLVAPLASADPESGPNRSSS